MGERLFEIRTSKGESIDFACESIKCEHKNCSILHRPYYVLVPASFWDDTKKSCLLCLSVLLISK
jgi:hypothetical protein